MSHVSTKVAALLFITILPLTAEGGSSRTCSLSEATLDCPVGLSCADAAAMSPGCLCTYGDTPVCAGFGHPPPCLRTTSFECYVADSCTDSTEHCNPPCSGDQCDDCDEQKGEDCCSRKAGSGSVDTVTGSALYTAHRPDALVQGTLWEFRLDRHFSSWLAVNNRDERSEGDLPKHRSWGGGWWQPFEVTLTVGGWMSDNIWFEAADGTREQMDVYVSSGPDFNEHRGRNKKTMRVRETLPGWELTAVNGDKLIFDRGWGNLRGRLVTVIEKTGRTINLDYYSDASVDPACQSADQATMGRLCRVTTSDNAYATFHYSGSFLTSVDSGLTVHPQPQQVTEYQYTSGPRPASPNPNVPYRILTDVTYKAWSPPQTAYQEIDHETAEYTYTTDDGVGLIQRDFRVPSSMNSVIANVLLLATVYDGSGRLLQAHTYDDKGRARRHVSAHEYLSLDYPGGNQTHITNLSSGADALVTVSTAGVENVIGDCGCSGSPITFQRAGSSVTGQLNSQNVRTDYRYDANLLVDRRLDNWPSALVGEPTKDELLAAPARVTYFAYHPQDSSLQVETGPRLSVLAIDNDTTTNPVTTLSDFDLDYDDTPNEMTPLDSRPRRTLVRGYTVSDLGFSLIYDTRITETHYDPAGRVEKIVDPRGTKTNYTYYPLDGSYKAGRLSAIDVEGVVVQRFSDYSVWGVARSVSSEDASVIVHETDLAGRITKTTRANLVTDYGYLSNGLLDHVIVTDTDSNDPPSAIYYAYGGVNALALCRSPNISTNSAACVSAVSTLGTVIQEERGFLTSTRNGTAFTPVERRTHDYDNAGNRTATKVYGSTDGFVSPNRVRSTEFDSRGELIRRKRFANDPAVPDGVEDLYRNSIGRITSVTEERFSPTGVSHTANLANSNRSLTYDSLGRVEKVTEKGPSGDVVTSYGYDLHDNLTSVTMGGVTTSYQYDDFGQLVKVVSPDSGETRYLYDRAGNVTARRAGGVDTIYAYDVRGRITRESGPFQLVPRSPTDPSRLGPDWAPPKREYFYDAIDTGRSGAIIGVSCGMRTFRPTNLKGHLAWVRHDAGVTYFNYDEIGRVTSLYEQDGPTFSACGLHTTEFSYTADGRVKQVVYPSGLRIVYDFAPESGYVNRVQVYAPLDVSSPVVALDNFVFDAEGDLQSYRAGAIRFSSVHDLSGKLVSKSYDGPGNDDYVRTMLEDSGRTVPGQRIVTFRADVADRRADFTAVHDELDRLHETQSPVLQGRQNCIFDYDAAGNRKTLSCSFGASARETRDTTYAYEPASNRIDSVVWGWPEASTEVSKDIVEDAAGRIIRHWSGPYPGQNDWIDISYDRFGNMTSAQTRAGSWKYVYDHRDLRRLKETSTPPSVRSAGTTTRTWYTYDLQGHLIEEHTIPNGGIRSYVWLGEDLVAVVDSGGASPSPRALVIGTNHLGAPERAWQVDTGRFVWGADYEAFGRAHEYLPGARSRSRIQINVRLPGQYLDRETGLHYNWHRYYDPDSGRYLQWDPLGQLDGPSAFSYARNNPLSRTDRAGLCSGIVNTRPCPPIITPLPSRGYLQSQTVPLSVCSSGVGRVEGTQLLQSVKTALGQQITITYTPNKRCEKCPPPLTIPCYYWEEQIQELDVVIAQIVCEDSPFPGGPPL